MGESKGIVSLLTMLKEDLEDEIKNGVKNEAQAQADYEAALNKAKTVLANLEKKSRDLRGAISLTTEAIDEAKEAKKDNQEDLDQEKEYLAPSSQTVIGCTKTSTLVARSAARRSR